MTTIAVKKLNDNLFDVTVTEGASSAQFSVSVPDASYQKLTDGSVSRERCVEAAFKFLLDREPKESILRRFDLPVISRYFPDFESRFRSYL